MARKKYIEYNDKGDITATVVMDEICEDKLGFKKFIKTDESTKIEGMFIDAKTKVIFPIKTGNSSVKEESNNKLNQEYKEQESPDKTMLYASIINIIQLSIIILLLFWR